MPAGIPVAMTGGSPDTARLAIIFEINRRQLRQQVTHGNGGNDFALTWPADMTRLQWFVGHLETGTVSVTG